MYGEKLKKARKKTKMSQEEVALKLNTSRSNISKYENEKLEPNIETLKMLCELYDLSADELLGLNIKKENSNSITKNSYSINQNGDNNQANINLGSYKNK